jgi:hypothetical protein
MKQGTISEKDREAFYQLADLPSSASVRGTKRGPPAQPDSQPSVSSLVRMVSSLSLSPNEMESVSNKLQRQQTEWEAFYQRFNKPTPASTPTTGTAAPATPDSLATEEAKSQSSAHCNKPAAVRSEQPQADSNDDDDDDDDEQAEAAVCQHPMLRETSEMCEWLEMAIERKTFLHLGRFWLALRAHVRVVSKAREAIVGAGQEAQLTILTERAKALIRKCEREFGEHLPCDLEGDDDEDHEDDDDDDDVFFDDEEDDVFY